MFFHQSPTLSHFHQLQVGNCGSNSRLVVDEKDNGKFRLQRFKLMWLVFPRVDYSFFTGVALYFQVLITVVITPAWRDVRIKQTVITSRVRGAMFTCPVLMKSRTTKDPVLLTRSGMTTSRTVCQRLPRAMVGNGHPC